jgi:undecaprenyl-diphosphatase
MTILQALFLGTLQGITEFLPVSSSGHLVLFRHLMDLRDVPLLFDVILHVATLVVVLFVFRKRVLRLLVALLHLVTRKKTGDDDHQLRLILLIIVATFFTGVIGLGIMQLDAGRYPKVVSALFLLTGAILITTKWLGGKIDYRDIGIRQGVLTGIAQGFALLPGISRSGITIAAALGSGMNREKAGEFSFLISLPAILGALVLELRHSEALLETVAPLAILSGFMASLLVGFASLSFLLMLVRGGKLYLFSFYLIPLGLFGIIML